MSRSFWVLAEQVLVEHGLDFVFGCAGLLIEVLSLAELAEDVESDSLGTAAGLSGRGRGHVLVVRGLGQLGDHHLLI